MGKSISTFRKRVKLYRLLRPRTKCTPWFRWKYTVYLLIWYEDMYTLEEMVDVDLHSIKFMKKDV